MDVAIGMIDQLLPICKQGYLLGNLSPRCLMGYSSSFVEEAVGDQACRVSCAKTCRGTAVTFVPQINRSALDTVAWGAFEREIAKPSEGVPFPFSLSPLIYSVTGRSFVITQLAPNLYR